MEDVFRRMKMRVVVGRTVETTTMIAVLRTISLGTILAASGDFDGTGLCSSEQGMPKPLLCITDANEFHRLHTTIYCLLMAPQSFRLHFRFRARRFALQRASCLSIPQPKSAGLVSTTKRVWSKIRHNNRKQPLNKAAEAARPQYHKKAFSQPRTPTKTLSQKRSSQQIPRCPPKPK